MMETFQQLLPVTLNEAEGHHFQMVYRKQALLGDLPALFLSERFRFLKSVLWEMQESADPTQAVAVLYRLLSYYSDMASNRRIADRHVQNVRRTGGRRLPWDSLFVQEDMDGDAEDDSVSHSAGAESQSLGSVSDDMLGLDCDPDAPESETSASFRQLAAQVRAAKKVRCKCKEPNWEDRVEMTDAQDGIFTHFCLRCNYKKTSRVPLVELKQIAGSHQS